jgi:hypothetical protein
MSWEHRGELRADPGGAPGERNIEAAGRRRSIWPSIAVVAAAAAFGGVIWFAYQNGRNPDKPGPPPLVKAENGPIKVKPDQPGGQEIPFQNSTVYDRGRRNPQDQPVEKLLPPPESPSPEMRAAPNANAPATADAPPPAPDAQSPTALAPAPGVILSRPPPPARIPPQTAPQTAPSPPKDETVVAKAQPQAVKPAARVAAAKTAASSPHPASVGGAYRIQLAAVSNEDSVKPQWDKLKRRAPETLDSLRMTTAKYTAPGKGTFYRIQAGPLDQAGAKSACLHLKERGLDCIVVKP